MADLTQIHNASMALAGVQLSGAIPDAAHKITYRIYQRPFPPAGAQVRPAFDPQFGALLVREQRVAGKAVIEAVLTAFRAAFPMVALADDEATFAYTDIPADIEANWFWDGANPAQQPATTTPFLLGVAPGGLWAIADTMSREVAIAMLSIACFATTKAATDNNGTAFTVKRPLALQKVIGEESGFLTNAADQISAATCKLIYDSFSRSAPARRALLRVLSDWAMSPSGTDREIIAGQYRILRGHGLAHIERSLAMSSGFGADLYREIPVLRLELPALKAAAIEFLRLTPAQRYYHKAIHQSAMLIVSRGSLDMHNYAAIRVERTRKASAANIAIPELANDVKDAIDEGLRRLGLLV
ncbi:MAG: hypothetical protein [Apple virus B]|uniref:Sigma-54 factor interaction domain-containing protein n=1 Tax=Apple virus B TaxID=2709746 RepID=A0A6C0X4K5_9MONO|nr:MAG: hypothetical protein QKO18_gp3 [Apple virus B]QIC52848.1 MAG: hypothetical protein [Apple virus B]